jgi:hypothetical protein
MCVWPGERPSKIKWKKQRGISRRRNIFKQEKEKEEGANITHTNLCLCCGRPFSPNVQSRPFSNKWKPIFLPFEKYDVYSYKRKAPGKHTVHSIDIDPPGKLIQNPINLVIFPHNVCLVYVFSKSNTKSPVRIFLWDIIKQGNVDQHRKMTTIRMVDVVVGRIPSPEKYFGQ